jgi:AcrR family transcriptional regulator
MPATARHTRREARPRRAQILEETLRIVAERGYFGFGIQELAERCGLTKPGLLHHFGSKDQLLIALLNDLDAKEEADLAAMFLPAQERAATPEAHRETYREAACTIMERAMRQPEIIRLHLMLQTESLNPAHPAHDYFKTREAMVLDRLTKGARPFAAHPLSAARQVRALMSGLQEQWIRADQGFDLAAEGRRALDAISF